MGKCGWRPFADATDVLKAVEEATKKDFPGVPVVPIMVVGATDGRMLREIGIPIYGVQGLSYNRDDIRFQGQNGRLTVSLSTKRSDSCGIS